MSREPSCPTRDHYLRIAKDKATEKISTLTKPQRSKPSEEQGVEHVDNPTVLEPGEAARPSEFEEQAAAARSTKTPRTPPSRHRSYSFSGAGGPTESSTPSSKEGGTTNLVSPSETGLFTTPLRHKDSGYPTTLFTSGAFTQYRDSPNLADISGPSEEEFEQSFSEEEQPSVVEVAEPDIEEDNSLGTLPGIVRGFAVEEEISPTSPSAPVQYLYQPEEERGEDDPTGDDSSSRHNQTINNGHEATGGGTNNGDQSTGANNPSPGDNHSDSGDTNDPNRRDNFPIPGGNSNGGNQAITVRMAHPRMKFQSPPIFKGLRDEDPLDWLARYELIGGYNGWTNDELRNCLVMYLDGPARKWYLCMGNTVPARWLARSAVLAADGSVTTPAAKGLRD